MTAGPRITVVTGAASGMGQAVAGYLQAQGGRVIGVDRAASDVVADLSSPQGRAVAIERVTGLCPGGVDAVIACAGLANPDGPQMVSVNYYGAVGVLLGLHPLLSLGRSPRAVAISSSASILPSDPELVRLCLDGEEAAARARAADNPLAYASSKLALSRWIRRTSIQAGWAPSSVLLNGVAPGQVRTPMVAPMLQTEEGRARLQSSAPFATPDPAQAEDIAPLLAFLASEQNRYMVGQVVFCDGGKDVLLRGESV